MRAILLVGTFIVITDYLSRGVLGEHHQPTRCGFLTCLDPPTQ